MTFIKNSSFGAKIAMSAIGVAFAITLLFSSSAPANAALTTSQVDAIIGLLQSFGAEQSVVDNVYVSLTGTTPSGGSSSSCLNLQNNLWLGLSDSETGGDVTKLQKFLAQDSNVYPEGEITGYYGPLTLEAVKRWQAKHGVVSSGTPETTGYGVVGPKTRKAMNESCDGGSTLSVTWTGTAILGNTIAVSWSNLQTTANAKDWVGLVPQGKGWSEGLPWFYTDGLTSGTKSMEIPSTITLGTYELVYFAGPAPYQAIKRSGPVYVTDVQTGQLSVSLHSEIVPDMTAVAGARQQTFAYYVLNAQQSAEDIKLTSIQLAYGTNDLNQDGAVNSLDSSIANAKGWATHLTNCRLYEGNTTIALNTGANIVNPTAMGQYINFNLDPGISFVIQKGTYKEIRLKCDISASATGSYRWGIDNSAAINAVGLTTGKSIKPSVIGDIGKLVTLSGVPVATIALPADGIYVSTGNTSFTGNASGGSSSYKYYWDFGDGGGSFSNYFEGASQTLGHYFNVAGTYFVTLKIIDSNGQSSITDSIIVHVDNQPSITILTPNGGEKWQIGKTYSIIWQGTEKIHGIELLKNGVSIYRFTGNSGNPPYEPLIWQVPGNIPPYGQVLLPDSDYKIRVNGASTSDESDSAFTIIPAPFGTDLAITNLKVFPSSPVANEKVMISYTIINYGNRILQSNFKHSISYPPGSQLVTLSSNCASGVHIGAGESCTAIHTVTYNKSGQYTILANVSLTDTNEDIDKSNNSASIKFVVGTPITPSITYTGTAVAGKPLEISWSNLKTTDGAKDWIALVPQGKDWSKGLPWFYTDGLTSGTKSLNVPDTLIPGRYEILYHVTDQGEVSSPRVSITVDSNPSEMNITVSNTTIPAGGTFTVSWGNLQTTTNAKDWIGLVPHEGTWSSGMPWFFTDGLTSGTKSMEISSTMTPGIYNLMYFKAGPAPYQSLKRSGLIYVTSTTLNRNEQISQLANVFNVSEAAIREIFKAVGL